MMVAIITNTPEPVIRSTYTLGMLASRLARLKSIAPFFGVSFESDDKALRGKDAVHYLKSIGV